MSLRRASGFVLGFALMLAAVGCGNSDRPPMAEVTGTVVYRGQPVEGATVTFLPEAKGMRSAGALTDAEGHFELMTFEDGDGAIVGKHRVTVVKRGPPAATKLPEGMGAAFLEEKEAQAADQGQPLLPAKYFSPETSGLEREVTSDDNHFDLELTD